MGNELSRLQSGEGQALAEVFDRYRPRLRHMVHLRIHGKVHRRIDASDVVQETYLDAAGRLDEYLREPRVPVYVWLRGIAQGRLMKTLRDHLGAQCRTTDRELATSSPSSIEPAVLSMQTSPSQAAQREELQSRVRVALTRLAEIDREVLLMRHFEGLDNHEVAAILGIGETAATMRYGRALARLERELGSVRDVVTEETAR